ncbi:hypothetical protein NMG60_11005313 [Bertholletia excelsa]
MFQGRVQMIQILKENLRVAQNRMWLHTNKKKTERVFEVGDWVFLNIQPFKMISPRLRRQTKLSIECYGPYQVLETVCTVAYKLRLLAGTKMHLVFHVPLLNK